MNAIWCYEFLRKNIEILKLMLKISNDFNKSNESVLYNTNVYVFVTRISTIWVFIGQKKNIRTKALCENNAYT